MSVLGGLDLEKCKGFPSPGTKETVRLIMKSQYYAGVRTAGFDYIYQDIGQHNWCPKFSLKIIFKLSECERQVSLVL